MGNRQRSDAPGGVAALELTETPVYLLGAAPEVVLEHAH
jgi:hypothetical protein